MTSFLAVDDPVLGAPHAYAGVRELFVLVAPGSCLLIPGSVPAAYRFNRHDYTWLALSLVSVGNDPANLSALEAVFFGVHTLTWAATHAIVSQAVAAGFNVDVPSDIHHAIRVALDWSATHRSSLRLLVLNDFETLPIIPPRMLSNWWWCSTSFVAWSLDGLVQPLVHVMGYCGSFWDVQSRGADSRFSLAFVLTKEFLPVSNSVPLTLHGSMSIRFYTETMLPHRFLRFPAGLSALLSSLRVRWGYFNGDLVQAKASLMSLLPIMLPECPNVLRVLSPAVSTTSQLSAYQLLLMLLSPHSPMHLFETMQHVDSLLSPFMHLIAQADAAPAPVYAEVRVAMLKGTIEAQRLAVASAPTHSLPNVKAGEAAACKAVLQSLMDIVAEPLMVGLTSQLSRHWTMFEQRPVEVFESVFASKSWTCVAILFEHLSGVKEAGAVFAILEQAAKERINYFTFRLCTPKGVLVRPDHTCWYSYSARIDNLLQAEDFDVFRKINFFELGATIRRLRDKIKFEQAHLPRPGQEFGGDMFLEHLTLISYVGPWLEALGFELMGPAGFNEALRIFSLFGQHGLHYQSQLRARHQAHLRDLFVALLKDMHSSMIHFRSRPLISYTKLITTNAMFSQDGAFYSTHRDLKFEEAELDRLSGYGCFSHPPTQQARPPFKRPFRATESTAPLVLPPPPKRLAITMRPPSPTVGSFSFAVKDLGDIIEIWGQRYAKRPILAKLNLTEKDICLPAYLSTKGGAACLQAGEPGHERLDSSLHVFSEEARTLRSQFDLPPYRLPRATRAQVAATQRSLRSAARQINSSSVAGSSSASVPPASTSPSAHRPAVTDK